MDSRFPELDALYRDVVLDHYRSPRGRKEIDHPDIENHGMNPVCGDEVKVALKMEGDTIGSVSVQSRGCAISVASGSMMAELLPGKTSGEVERLEAAFRGLLKDQGVPVDQGAGGLDLGDLEALEGVKRLPVRVKCALLAWITLRDALLAWRRNGAHRPVAPSSTEHLE